MNRSYTGFWPKTAFFDYMKTSAGGHLVFLAKNRFFIAFGWRAIGFSGTKNFSGSSAGGQLVFLVKNELFRVFGWRAIGFSSEK